MACRAPEHRFPHGGNHYAKTRVAFARPRRPRAFSLRAALRPPWPRCCSCCSGARRTTTSARRSRRAVRGRGRRRASPTRHCSWRWEPRAQRTCRRLVHLRRATPSASRGRAWTPPWARSSMEPECSSHALRRRHGDGRRRHADAGGRAAPLGVTATAPRRRSSGACWHRASPPARRRRRRRWALSTSIRMLVVLAADLYHRRPRRPRRPRRRGGAPGGRAVEMMLTTDPRPPAARHAPSRLVGGRETASTPTIGARNLCSRARPAAHDARGGERPTPVRRSVAGGRRPRADATPARGGREGGDVAPLRSALLGRRRQPTDRGRRRPLRPRRRGAGRCERISRRWRTAPQKVLNVVAAAVPARRRPAAAAEGGAGVARAPAADCPCSARQACQL